MTLPRNPRPGCTNGTRWIRPEKRLALYLRDGFRCVYCDQDLRWAGVMGVSLDHLRPRSRNGSNEPQNLVTACVSCNASRQDTPWRAFATLAQPGALKRILRQTRRALPLALAKQLLSEGLDAHLLTLETAR